MGSPKGTMRPQSPAGSQKPATPQSVSPGSPFVAQPRVSSAAPPPVVARAVLLNQGVTAMQYLGQTQIGRPVPGSGFSSPGLSSRGSSQDRAQAVIVAQKGVTARFP